MNDVGSPLRTIPPELGRQLDRLPFAAIAEYVAARAGVEVGRRELHLKFRDGRYQRVYDRQPLNVR